MDQLRSVESIKALRRLLSPRCKVLSAKPCLWQNSLCRSPLDSNSTTSRLISRRLRRSALTTSLSVIPTVHQKRARSTRGVRLTETILRPGFNDERLRSPHCLQHFLFPYLFHHPRNRAPIDAEQFGNLDLTLRTKSDHFD